MCVIGDKMKKEYIIPILMFVSVLLLTLANWAYASGGHHDGEDGRDGVDGANGTNGVDGKDGINGLRGKQGLPGIDGLNGSSGMSYGVASAISAAQCHFDGGSFDLQLCGGYGNAFGQDAYTFGAGQKIGDFLFNFTETTENGKSSHGFGVNWKVKLK